MSFTASFFVNGDPKAQPRPRAFAMTLANGKTQTRVYDPHTAEGWKSLVAHAARPHAPKEPLTGPMRVDMIFEFRRPKSHYLKVGLRDDAPVYHTSKPDRDNCEKAVLDCLTQLGFWKDDSQVCDGEIKKIYGDLPGLNILITQINQW